MRMQYPNDINNPNFDGKPHFIKPKRLLKVTNTNYYLLEYFDLNLRKSMFTFLVKDGTYFSKIPLEDYSKVKELLNLLSFEEIDYSVLGKNINCSDISSIETLYEGIISSGKNCKKTLEKEKYAYQQAPAPSGGGNNPPSGPNDSKNQNNQVNVYEMSDENTDKPSSSDIYFNNVSHSGDRGQEKNVFYCYDVNTKNLLAIYDIDFAKEPKEININTCYYRNITSDDEYFSNIDIYYKRSFDGKFKYIWDYNVTNDIQYHIYLIPVYDQNIIDAFSSYSVDKIQISKTPNICYDRDSQAYILFEGLNGINKNVRFSISNAKAL